MADIDETTARAQSRNKYQRILQELWTVKPDKCPIDGTKLWDIGDMVEARLRPQATGLLTGIEPPQAYLYVPVTCVHCGYTMFFNISVLNKKPDPGESGQAS